MKKIIGIRREDKNKWERRVPLIPADVEWLKSQAGVETQIQPSTIRVFGDDEYGKSGAAVQEDLDEARVVLAVKEMPESFFRPGRTYIFFSHTIKGQSYNMSMLKKLMALGCNLIDYERVVDEAGRRLIFFGRYAGLAGMIDTLHALGEKLKLRGHDTPLTRVRSAYEYASLEEAKREIAAIGAEIEKNGVPEEITPLVVAFTGYGNVSRGAQEIFDLLPHKVVSAPILAANYDNFTADPYYFYKVVFKEEDLVRHRDGDKFDLQEYYDHPDRYESTFEPDLKLISVLVNGIYWTEKYPRLVTRENLLERGALERYLNPLVIGDISCDIHGSIEITERATHPDAPCYTFLPSENRIVDGIDPAGVTVMAVDNLPCEFPREASGEFSHVLREYVPQLFDPRFLDDGDPSVLPYPLRQALILHRGQLTPDYAYMQEFINSSR